MGFGHALELTSQTVDVAEFVRRVKGKETYLEIDFTPITDEDFYWWNKIFPIIGQIAKRENTNNFLHARQLNETRKSAHKLATLISRSHNKGEEETLATETSWPNMAVKGALEKKEFDFRWASFKGDGDLPMKGKSVHNVQKLLRDPDVTMPVAYVALGPDMDSIVNACLIIQKIGPTRLSDAFQITRTQTGTAFVDLVDTLKKFPFLANVSHLNPEYGWFGAGVSLNDSFTKFKEKKLAKEIADYLNDAVTLSEQEKAVNGHLALYELQRSGHDISGDIDYEIYDKMELKVKAIIDGVATTKTEKVFPTEVPSEGGHEVEAFEQVSNRIFNFPPSLAQKWVTGTTISPDKLEKLYLSITVGISDGLLPQKTFNIKNMDVTYYGNYPYLCVKFDPFVIKHLFDTDSTNTPKNTPTIKKNHAEEEFLTAEAAIQQLQSNDLMEIFGPFCFEKVCFGSSGKDEQSRVELKPEVARVVVNSFRTSANDPMSCFIQRSLREAREKKASTRR